MWEQIHVDIVDDDFYDGYKVHYNELHWVTWQFNYNTHGT
jgi:hypothetical protein